VNEWHVARAKPLGPHEEQLQKKRFYRFRVAVLLTILAGVVVYAALDYVQRHARRQWQRPLHIAMVLLESGPLDPVALHTFQGRVQQLEAVLEAEYERYGGAFRPVLFQQFGPVPERAVPPLADPDPSFWEPLLFSLRLWQYARQSDREAGLLGGHADGKIYVRLSPPRSLRRARVEGLGQDGGRIAVASIELSEHSVDFGLFVIAHELFHLLGASDRYAADGKAVIPEGLGEPELEPRYPQRSVEVMARGRVLSPGDEVPPSHLDELRVGPMTATEIGWAR
jgi:hypothetical protein